VRQTREQSFPDDETSGKKSVEMLALRYAPTNLRSIWYLVSFDQRHFFEVI
jgi:hypothetical protein